MSGKHKCKTGCYHLHQLFLYKCVKQPLHSFLTLETAIRPYTKPSPVDWVIISIYLSKHIINECNKYDNKCIIKVVILRIGFLFDLAAALTDVWYQSAQSMSSYFVNTTAAELVYVITVQPNTMMLLKHEKTVTDNEDHRQLFSQQLICWRPNANCM